MYLRAEAGASLIATRYAWALPGNRTHHVTSARYLLDRLDELVLRGLVRRGPYRQDLSEPEAREGELTFILPVNLAKGEHKLMVRALNRIGQSQPVEPLWNPAGYMRNVIETTRVIAA